MDINKFRIDISISDVNKLKIECQIEDAVEYAYYIYWQDQCIAKFNYSENNCAYYWLSEPGEYRVKVFARDISENKISKNSEVVKYDATTQFLEKEEPGTVSFFQQIGGIAREIIENFPMLVRMARFDYKLENKDTYLGKVWAFLTPLIQIGTYWLVFGIGLRNGRDIDGNPFLVWMLAGLVPWFFMNKALLGGANSIYMKSGIVSKMKFPIATIPISRILQEVYGFVVSMIILFIVFFAFGYYPNIYYLNLIYYIFYLIVFLVGLSLVTSVLTMVARDFYKLLGSVMKLLFYVTPILWQMDAMPQLYQDAMKYNPFYYVVTGFRECMLYNRSFYENMDFVIFFWSVNVLLLLIGCNLQAKFKYKFVDLL